jgi:hypothetical protein
VKLHDSSPLPPTSTRFPTLSGLGLGKCSIPKEGAEVPAVKFWEKACPTPPCKQTILDGASRSTPRLSCTSPLVQARYPPIFSGWLNAVPSPLKGFLFHSLNHRSQSLFLSIGYPYCASSQGTVIEEWYHPALEDACNPQPCLWEAGGKRVIFPRNCSTEDFRSS